jgi:hypothetical protein
MGLPGLLHDHHGRLRRHWPRDKRRASHRGHGDVIGIAYVAILTAALAQQFFNAVVDEEVRPAEHETLELLRNLDARLARLEPAVEQVQGRTHHERR